MKKNINSYLEKMVSRVISETLEEKADSLVNKIKGDIKELGGMDDEHPKFGKMNTMDMSDEEIEALMRKVLPAGNDEEEEFDFEEMTEETGGECSECGGMMREGECSECGYKMEVEEGIYDVSDDFDKEQEFDYVEEEMTEEDNNDMEAQKEMCKRIAKENPEELQHRNCEGFTGELDETLHGGQKKLDKNKNGKIDAEDFKMLRKGKKKETDEQWQGAVVRAVVPMAASYIGSKLAETDEEVEEGNAFTGALSKAKEDGKSEFEVDGKKYHVKETVKLTESEIIDLIERIVKEQKQGLKTIGKPKGLTKYEQVHKADGKQNDEYIKSVAKKMKEYLKDGSKGEYDTNPKHFPKGNGELGEMKKKAYKASGAVEDYVDNFTAAGLENLNYDEIDPNEDWVSDNVKGSSRTGNNPKWGNAVETDVNTKRDEIRKKNLLGKIKKKAYNKSAQPISKDTAGENEGDKIMAKLESIEPKKEQKLNEEFDKMKKLISYSQKTQ
jgi:hypothetical protein